MGWSGRRVGIALACATYAAAGASAQHNAVAAFHHVHMNVVDPSRSVAFYTSMFDTTMPERIAGWEAVRSDGMHVLFTRVPQPASTAFETAVWHLGWGAGDDIAAFVARASAQGGAFERTSPVVSRLKGVDGNPIEINTEYLHLTPHSKAFSHVHMFSAAPYCAADWYQRMLGAAPIEGADYEKVLGKALVAGIVPRGPTCDVPSSSAALDALNAHPSALLKLGSVPLLIFPKQQPDYLDKNWGGRRPTSTSLVSTRGHIIDHIAVEYPDVERALARLKARGVTVLEELHAFGTTTRKAAMIEGPDGMAIELIERR